MSKTISEQESPFRAGTGMLGATEPGQRVTAENVSLLPPGSVVRLDADNGILVHLHDDIWYWNHGCAWCYDRVERFHNRLPGTLCHLPVILDDDAHAKAEGKREGIEEAIGIVSKFRGDVETYDDNVRGYQARLVSRLQLESAARGESKQEKP